MATDLTLGAKDPSCYVCGCENPVGLHVVFERDGEKGSRATYTVQPGHVGWPGVLHGGLLFALMDESLGWALLYRGLRGVTARTETRFRTPVSVGEHLVITGSILECVKNIARARAEVRRSNGNNQKVAELTATMFLLDASEQIGASEQPA